MTSSDILITKLKELKNSKSETSYSHIKNILKNQRIPVAVTQIKPFKIIRYRRHNKNDRDKFFQSSEDLSYRQDILNIDKFGRANEPGQGFFYCNDNKNQNTGIAEIVSIFRGNTNSKEEVLTIGAWDVNIPLKLAVILPTNENRGQSEELDALKAFYNSFDSGPDFEDLKKFNEFLAKEFTLDVEKHQSNYKITSAFSNYIKETFDTVDGIVYSSVKSEHEGNNIVLWPEVVEKKLKFVAARKSVFKKFKHKAYIEEVLGESESYKTELDKIVW